MIALPHAEKAVEMHLTNLGFPQAQVNKATIKPTGLSFDTIQLDRDGFNTINNMDVTLFWPSYIVKRQIDGIKISAINLLMTERDIRRTIRRLTKINEFISLPAHNIAIENIDVSMTAGKTSLRFNCALNITHDNDKHHLTGQLNASQYDLSFTSQWTGLINKNEEILEIDGNIEGLNIKSNALAVNRGVGWVSYHAHGADNILGAQFDAGSGQIFNLPANSINVTIGQDETSYPVLLRSQLSGVNDTVFNADFAYHTDVTKRDFLSVLSIANQKEFLEHLVSLNFIESAPKTIDNNALDILLNYEPEKRFPAGPLPFSLSSNQNFEGTILFYPDSYELRGTLQADENNMNILKDIFDISDENITDNVIRLDQNIQSLF